MSIAKAEKEYRKAIEANQANKMRLLEEKLEECDKTIYYKYEKELNRLNKRIELYKHELDVKDEIIKKLRYTLRTKGLDYEL